MKVIRVQNPIGIDYMAEHLLDDGRKTDELVEALKGELMTNPNDIFVLHIWDEDKLVGFIVAMNLPAKTHVFLYQAWADPKTPADVVDKAFFRLLLWVDSLNKTEIRMETTRNEEAFAKKWNFKKFSTIMSFTLYDGYEKDIMAKLRGKEIDSKK